MFITKRHPTKLVGWQNNNIMELFTEPQKRIRGKFAKQTHANLYESMKNRLELKFERLNRQIIGFWKLIRMKDELIIQLKQENKELRDVIFNLKQTIEKNKRK